MTDSKHTPGPWSLGEVRDGYQYIDSRPGAWFEIASVVIKTEDEDDDGNITAIPSPQGEANAILIASAPDLLEALKKVTKQLEIVSGVGRVHDERMAIWDAREAIAKATGAA